MRFLLCALGVGGLTLVSVLSDDGRRKNWPKRFVKTNTQDEDESTTNYSIRETNTSLQSLRKTSLVLVWLESGCEAQYQYQMSIFSL